MTAWSSFVAQWVKDLMLSLLTLVIAMPWVQFLAWELPHTMGTDKKKKKINSQ